MNYALSANLPFYVVKSGDGLYFAEGGWMPQQSRAKPFTSRAKAKGVTKRRHHPSVGRCYDVLVWPRPHAPKLPVWVKPSALGDRQIAVFTIGKGWVEEHIFFVHPVGSVAPHGHLAPVGWWIHYEARKRMGAGTFTQAAPEVWIEAACRAKALVLRERGGK